MTHKWYHIFASTVASALLVLLAVACSDDIVDPAGPQNGDAVYISVNASWKSGRDSRAARSVDSYYKNLPAYGAANVGDVTDFPLRLYPQTLWVHVNPADYESTLPASIFIGKTTTGNATVSPSARRSNMHSAARSNAPYRVQHADGHTRPKFLGYDSAPDPADVVDNRQYVYADEVFIEKTPTTGYRVGNKSVFTAEGYQIYFSVNDEDKGIFVANYDTHDSNDPNAGGDVFTYYLDYYGNPLVKDNFDDWCYADESGQLYYVDGENVIYYKDQNGGIYYIVSGERCAKDNEGYYLLTSTADVRLYVDDADEANIAAKGNSIGYFDTTIAGGVPRRLHPAYICDLYAPSPDSDPAAVFYDQIKEENVYDANGQILKVEMVDETGIFSITKVDGETYYVNYNGEASDYNPDQPDDTDYYYVDDNGNLVILGPDGDPICVVPSPDSDPKQSVGYDDYGNPLFVNPATGETEYHGYPEYPASAGNEIVEVNTDNHIYNVDYKTPGVQAPDNYVNPFWNMPYDPAGRPIAYNPTLWPDGSSIEGIIDNDFPMGYIDYHDCRGYSKNPYPRETFITKPIDTYWPWTADGPWKYKDIPTFGTHDFYYDHISNATVEGRADDGHVTLELKHACAILRLSFGVAQRYYNVRKVVIRDVQVSVNGSTPSHFFQEDARVPVDMGRPGFVVPVASSTPGDYSKHGVYSYCFFKPEYGEDGVTATPWNTGEPAVVKKDTELTFVITYDVYDNDLPITNAWDLALKNDDHLTRGNFVKTATFKFSNLGSDMDAHLQAGHYYDLYLTIDPEYLYVLSEHDDKCITIE